MPKHFISHYTSPNILIQPTVMIPTPPSPKRAKIDSSPIKQSPINVDISFLDDFNIDEIVSCLQKSDGMHDNLENHNKVEETSSTKKDVKLDNILNIKMFDKRCTTHRCTTVYDTAKPEESNGLSFSKLIKESSNQKKDKNKDPPVEKNMDNIETKVLTLKEDINSTLSFKFIEYPAAKIKSSDHGLNNDLENYIRIKVNVNLVPNDNLKPTSVKANINNNLTRVEAENKENKEMHSSKNNILPLNNKLHELHTGDNFNTELKSIVESKKSSAKNIVRNRDDIWLATLERYILKTLHMQCSVLSIIHCGEHSKIFSCKNSGGEEYAIKMLHLRSRKINRGGIQTKIMLKQIQSDIPKENLFCIFLHDCFSVKKHWCFLMDFYPSNLRKVINDSSKPLNIHIVQDLARQLISAVMLLRNNNIVHSDIKPSHILINCSNDKLKLCGFDKAYYYNEQVCMTQCIGTLSYRPPEVILGYSAGFSIDVWSTGLVLHEMFTGRRLFPGYNNADVLYQQMSTLGSMPSDMITLSRFSAQYFIGDSFTQTFGFLKKRTKIIYHFNETNKLYRTINGAYFEHWAPSRTKNQRKYDIEKINSFVNLLQKIIVLHPKSRLPIEFVFANPFIYNMYY